MLRDYIQEVQFMGAKAVRLVTRFPAPPALLPLLTIDYTVIYTKHVLQTGVDFDELRDIVGSGPFKLKSYQDGQLDRLYRQHGNSKEAIRIRGAVVGQPAVVGAAQGGGQFGVLRRPRIQAEGGIHVPIPEINRL
jgi:hypothetical protein